LIEIQQNVDVTYRLYDYGRPRELHLEEAIAVADPVPYAAPFQPVEAEPGRLIAAGGQAFIVERWTKACSGSLQSPGRPLWVVVISGGGSLDGVPLEAGAVWIVEGSSRFTVSEGADLLLAYPGEEVIPDLLS
jgi:mannose-6-phosphate isomerase